MTQTKAKMSIDWQLAGIELIANFAASYFYLAEWEGNQVKNIAIGWIVASVVGIGTLVYPYAYLNKTFLESFLYWILAGGLGTGLARVLTMPNSESWLK
jgi:hypothetical protein